METTNGIRWLSRKDWRRLVELHATGRITRAELEALKLRLARTRRPVAAPARPPPRLVLLPGGRGAPGGDGPVPLHPSPRRAA
jgi:hypothetical protein